MSRPVLSLPHLTRNRQTVRETVAKSAIYGNRADCSFPDAEAATDAVAVSFLYSALA
jgi:hypothetical protein